MWFPDPNIGYICGYRSKVTKEGILVTFLGDRVKILFRFKDMEKMCTEAYKGGRISCNVIRWGKCPPGTEAIRVSLKNGLFKNHMIVFDNLEEAAGILKMHEINVTEI